MHLVLDMLDFVGAIDIFLDDWDHLQKCTRSYQSLGKRTVSSRVHVRNYDITATQGANNVVDNVAISYTRN